MCLVYALLMQRDGYITAGAVQQKEWVGMCAALDRPEWVNDERFATAAARNINRDLRLKMTEESVKQANMLW
jgi:crotonobetainyl-CoA:carnitine CoA-transferase CaiB-like acyl-CoA transferase